MPTKEHRIIPLFYIIEIFHKFKLKTSLQKMQLVWRLLHPANLKGLLFILPKKSNFKAS